VIVVNDQSTDRTPSILNELAARCPKLKIMNTGELPAGWVGKNFAVSTGAAAAAGDWLLFTDADTFHLPGSAQHALDDAGARHADLVSYSPEQETATFWERSLIPQVYSVLSRRYSFDRVNDPALPDAAANGQFLMIRKEIYQAVGGHREIAGVILEDVAFARRVKQQGYNLYFASGRGIVRTRMYRSFAAMWQGWSKNLYPLIGNSEIDLARELALLWAAPLVLVGVFLARPLHRAGWILLLIGAGLLLAQLFAYFRYLRRNLLPLFSIQYYVTGVLLYSAVLVASWWKTTRGTVQWKGRSYPAGTP
ncbi:MAG: glycosyltransferase, partial [Candidatus Acidiferrales bacterium]